LLFLTLGGDWVNALRKVLTGLFAALSGLSKGNGWVDPQSQRFTLFIEPVVHTPVLTGSGYQQIHATAIGVFVASRLAAVLCAVFYERVIQGHASPCWRYV
jgi:hypothetical protein